MDALVKLNRTYVDQIRQTQSAVVALRPSIDCAQLIMSFWTQSAGSARLTSSEKLTQSSARAVGTSTTASQRPCGSYMVQQ